VGGKCIRLNSEMSYSHLLRSTQNVRIERTWRDVRKDTLEVFRQVFKHLEELGLLDMENTVHRVCLFIVYQPRIQASLDRTRHSWNLHKIRTAGNKTPVALYELSKEFAIQRGFWTGDPGDDMATASSEMYGHDPDAPVPPQDELRDDPEGRNGSDEQLHGDSEHMRQTGIHVNDDDEISWAREILSVFDLDREDGNWAIDIYCEAVVYLSSYVAEHSTL
jgi:hypothetical protein